MRCRLLIVTERGFSQKKKGRKEGRGASEAGRLNDFQCIRRSRFLVLNETDSFERRFTSGGIGGWEVRSKWNGVPQQGSRIVSFVRASGRSEAAWAGERNDPPLLERNQDTCFS